MCLRIDHTSTKNFKRRHKENKKIVVWKYVIYEDGRFKSQYRRTRVKAGELVANSNSRYNSLSTIHGAAIHCWRNKFEAKKLKTCVANVYLLKCWAWTDDFIAAGLKRDIAFKKIYIPQSELDRVKAEIRKGKQA
jgi:hypothetical protein